MIDLPLIVSFAIATTFETLNPGPTFALVLETRVAKGRQAASSTVYGITLANVLAVLVVILGGRVSSAAVGDASVTVIKVLGAGYLIYLASRRVLSSTVRLVTGPTLRDDYETRTDDRGLVFAGFLAHFVNPVTLLYYVAVFGSAAAGQPVGTKILLGVIPVAVDFAVYEAAARYKPQWMSDNGDSSRVMTFRLLAGAALLYLVGRTFSTAPADSAGLSIAPLVSLMMLGGFLVGSVAEAHRLVVARRAGNNKMLWRVVALWGVCFSVFALFGALYSLVLGIDHSAMALSAVMESRLRICFVVAAVVAATLAFAKAFGELQDEQHPPDPSKTGIAPTWQAHPLIAGCAACGFLVAVFILLTVTDLRVQ